MLFIVYWCYGTQLSVNGATAADFWGTKNVGINYGMLFTAWGVAGLLGGRIGGLLYDKYHNYQMAFYTAAGLAAVALVCELASQATGGTERKACPVGKVQSQRALADGRLQVSGRCNGRRDQERSHCMRPAILSKAARILTDSGIRRKVAEKVGMRHKFTQS